MDMLSVKIKKIVEILSCDSETVMKALGIKETLSFELKMASTIEKIDEIRNRIPKGDKLEKKAVQLRNKMLREKLNTTKTPKEFMELYQKTEEGSKIEKDCLRGCLAVCEKDEDFENMFSKIKEGSKMEQDLFKRWLTKCATPESVKKVFEKTETGDKNEAAAIRRLAELLP